MKKILLIIFSLTCLSAYSQVSITNNNALVENFDGLGTAGSTHLTHWSGVRYAGTGTLNAALDPVVSNGGANSGAIYNVGTTSSTDRALGSLSSASTIPRFGVGFTNNTGALVKSVILSGFMEQWRTGSDAAVETLTFQYSTNATSVNDGAATWISLTGMNLVEKLTAVNTNVAIDGNLAANRTAINDFVNIDIVNGSTFYIRWSDANDAGSDGIYAIDDLSITFSTSLPITLTSFTGKEANKSIVLNWVTASEKNNKNFELFRSVDGKNFKSIGTVAGAGDSNSELKYSFIDANPFGGTNYYQLKQIDFDGKSSNSQIIPVDSKIEDTKITVYAASSSLNIGITSPNETSGKITLFDISGRKITEQNINLNKGYNNLELNETLTPGVHFITLENEGRVYRQKFIK